MDPSSGEVTARACGVLPDISALAPTLGSIQPPKFLSTIRFGFVPTPGTQSTASDAGALFSRACSNDAVPDLLRLS